MNYKISPGNITIEELLGILRNGHKVSLSSESVFKSKLVSNLAVFESAWDRWSENGSNGCIGLDEGSSSVSDVLAGIAKSWLSQYSDALYKLDPMIKLKKIIVCGGVAQKSKFAIRVLELLNPQRQFYLASTLVGEETFDGLVRLSIGNRNKVIST